MNTDPQIKAIEQKVTELISAEPGLFLVDIKIKPTNNIKVYIDGDQGVSIEKLVNYNRKLYKQIEEEAMYPNGDFSLEVSSPGLDEPLKMHRQYQKNIGRFAEITDIEGQKREGKLVGVGEKEIMLEETKGKGKKQEVVTHTISFEQIKSTKIQIKF
jgi:ribosome maturation factor RimP